MTTEQDSAPVAGRTDEDGGAESAQTQEQEQEQQPDQEQEQESPQTAAEEDEDDEDGGDAADAKGSAPEDSVQPDVMASSDSGDRDMLASITSLFQLERIAQEQYDEAKRMLNKLEDTERQNMERLGSQWDRARSMTIVGVLELCRCLPLSEVTLVSDVAEE